MDFSFKRRERRTILSKRTCCSIQQNPPPAWPGRAVPEPGRKSWDGPKPLSIVGSTGSIGTQVQIVSKNYHMLNSLKFLLKFQNIRVASTWNLSTTVNFINHQGFYQLVNWKANKKKQKQTNFRQKIKRRKGKRKAELFCLVGVVHDSSILNQLKSLLMYRRIGWYINAYNLVVRVHFD